MTPRRSGGSSRRRSSWTARWSIGLDPGEEEEEDEDEVEQVELHVPALEEARPGEEPGAAAEGGEEQPVEDGVRHLAVEAGGLGERLPAEPRSGNPRLQHPVEEADAPRGERGRRVLHARGGGGVAAVPGSDAANRGTRGRSFLPLPPADEAAEPPGREAHGRGVGDSAATEN